MCICVHKHAHTNMHTHTHPEDQCVSSEPLFLALKLKCCPNLNYLCLPLRFAKFHPPLQPRLLYSPLNSMLNSEFKHSLSFLHNNPNFTFTIRQMATISLLPCMNSFCCELPQLLSFPTQSGSVITDNLVWLTVYHLQEVNASWIGSWFHIDFASFSLQGLNPLKYENDF